MAQGNQNAGVRSQETGKVGSQSTPLSLSADTRIAVERYTATSVEHYRNGAMSKAEREEARSYAVEALNAIFRDNPDTFDYVARIEEVRQQKLHNGTEVPRG